MTEPIVSMKADIARISGEIDSVKDVVGTLAGVTFENQGELVKAFNALSDQLTELAERVSELDGKPKSGTRKPGFWQQFLTALGYRRG